MKKSMGRMFGERLAVALALVFVTWNIWGWSYVEWAFNTPFEGFGDVAGVGKLLVGVLLAVAYIAFFWATWRGAGPVGVLLAVIVCAAIIWFAHVAGWIDLANPSTSAILIQIVLAFVLALGAVWSIFWRRATGQISVEDPDTD